MITIRAKAKSGNITEFQVVEIIEIDGQPWTGAATPSQLESRVTHLEGVAEALMRAVFESEPEGETNGG